MDKTIKKPLVSVLMPVYNGQDYIKEAIESILSQTFSDFEFLIINDGSTDKSAEIIKSFADNRIKYAVNERNMGLPYTLNRGLEMAKGEYIARMDADDISLPNRLKRQIDFMKSHEEIAVCGTWIRTIGNSSNFVNKFFTDSDDVKASLLFNTSLAHPSVIIRKSELDKYGLLYDANYKYFEEDYALWVEFSKQARLANIPEVLLCYRIHKKSVSQENISNRREGVSLIRKRQLEKLGLSPSEENMRIHNSLQPKNGESVLLFIDTAEDWLQKIIDINKSQKIYEETSLNKIIYIRWLTVCGMNAKSGLSIWKKFIASPLFKNYERASIMDNIKIFIKCLLKK